MLENAEAAKGMLSCMRAFRFIIPQEEDKLANSLSRVLTRGRHFPSHPFFFGRFALTFKTRSSDVVNPRLCSEKSVMVLCCVDSWRF